MCRRTTKAEQRNPTKNHQAMLTCREKIFPYNQLTCFLFNAIIFSSSAVFMIRTKICPDIHYYQQTH